MTEQEEIKDPQAQNEPNQQTQADNESEVAAQNNEAQATEEPAEEPLTAEQQLQQQLDELKDKYLRSIAEFDNYKKRTLKEKTELILNGSERTVTAVLPVLDDMERALADKSNDATALREGVEMIYHKFVKALESLGVKKIETQGQDFNTDYHEAMAMVPGMGDEMKGKVIDCLQQGYTLNDKVIRHAKVAVAQ